MAKALTVLKETLGFLMALIEVLALLGSPPHVPGIALILLALVAALVWGVWGWLEKGHPNTLMRAAGRVSLGLAPLAFIFFAIVFSVRVFCDTPSGLGQEIKVSETTCDVKTPDPPASLKGECDLKVEQPADALEVVLTVMGEDRTRVKRISAIPESSLPDKIETLVLDDPKEAGVIVVDASPSMKITLALKVFLEAGEPTKRVQLQVIYRYAEKGKWWRFQRWVFERYG